MGKRKGAISTFIKELKNIKPKEGHTLYFRGHSDEAYKAIPSIYRKMGGGNKEYVDNEDRLFKSMIANCPQDFEGCVSAFDHLVKMQHYSLPTRLLDITSNPLVALYFVCCDHSKKGKPGEVLIYEVPDDEIQFYSGDTVSVISNLAKVPHDFDYSKSKKEFLNEIRSEKVYFPDAIEEKHLNAVICVKPKLDNPRVIRQSGAFFLFGMAGKKASPAEIPDKYIYNFDGKPHTIKITNGGKSKIIEELAQLGISAATLFPEIDRVALYLKEHPKGML